jgi:hypothetical protein
MQTVAFQSPAFDVRHRQQLCDAFSIHRTQVISGCVPSGQDRKIPRHPLLPLARRRERCRRRVEDWSFFGVLATEVNIGAGLCNECCRYQSLVATTTPIYK